MADVQQAKSCILDSISPITKDDCGGLLRPHVVWFGENLEFGVLQAADDHINSCDLCLVVGTSSIVYPAAMFAPAVRLLFSG